MFQKSPKAIAEPLEFLRLYGLDQILSERDDACLWAAVVCKYWRLPNDPTTDATRLRFAIGEANSKTEMKIQPTEAWGFERMDANTLRLRECPPSKITDTLLDKYLKEAVAASLLYLWSWEYWPYGAIVVTRPGAGKHKALVFAGYRANGLTGFGETKEWVRHRNNVWKETKKSIAQWIS
jgi:hypothetical protein